MNEDLPSINDFIENKSAPSEGVGSSASKYNNELYESMQLIENISNGIPEIPEIQEVRFYDEEIQEIREDIIDIKQRVIQELAQQISKVDQRDIPDFRWITKSFKVIDEDFENVNSTIATVRGKLDEHVTDIVESIEVAKFESKVDVGRIDGRINTAEQNIDNAHQSLTESINQIKEQVYKELRDSSLQIWDINKNYKKDDERIREETLKEYKSLQERVDSSIEGITTKTDKDYIEVSQYFLSLKKEIANLPLVKYYDEEIEGVSKEIQDVNESVRNVKKLLETFEKEINKKVEDVKEGLLNIPPNIDNSDPLTPLDQEFVTLDQLQDHYRLFVNRVQQQLATFGGGGAVWLWDLEDVNIGTPNNDSYPPIPNNSLLIYHSDVEQWVGIASTSLSSDDQTLDDVLREGNTSTLGMTVGVITGTHAFFDGNVTIGGTLIKQDVRDIDSIGLITARSGVHVSGVVSATTYTGDGSALTGVLTTYSGIVTDARGTDQDLLIHNGTSFVGIASTALASDINDYKQGYYRYNTHYYSTGVANTTQQLPADEFVLIQPSVRTNRVKYLPQVMLDANNSDPWIGAGATVGSGHTTFSLAGLDESATVIVRIAAQFNPDIDNTNVDFKLEFTTNTATQGTGLTNFSITREQAFVCNEGAEQPYISETLMNFYVGDSLSGMTTETAGLFKICVRSSDEGEFEMMALTVNVVV